MLKSFFPPGLTIGVRGAGITHYGIVTSRFDATGQQIIATGSATTGIFFEQGTADFGGGREVFVAHDICGSLPPSVVEARAMARLGETYRLFTYNCEHFVREAHGLPLASPQLKFWLVAGAIGGCVLLMMRSRRV